MAHKILILTSDAGFGHRRAAQAIEAALKERTNGDAEIEIRNPLDAPELPDIVRGIETGYDDFVVDDPTLYQIAYAATDAPVVAQLMQSVMTTFLNRILARWIQETRPDVIVTTYPAYTQALVRAAAAANRSIPVDVVVTDLIDVHSLWFHQRATLTFVPTENVYEQALQHGLPPARLKAFGLPVHPKFAKLRERDRLEIRRALGWDASLPAALIVGSSRSRQTPSIARLLDRSGVPVQIAAVAGGDAESHAALQATEWTGTVHTYGLVENMPEMMRAADFIICKAGGLIVSESLASGLALILYEALPGQEVGNVRYVVEHGAGAWSPGVLGALTTVYSWLVGEGDELAKCRAAAEQIGRPEAAYDIADQILEQVGS